MLLPLFWQADTTKKIIFILLGHLSFNYVKSLEVPDPHKMLASWDSSNKDKLIWTYILRCFLSSYGNSTSLPSFLIILFPLFSVFGVFLLLPPVFYLISSPRTKVWIIRECNFNHHGFRAGIACFLKWTQAEDDHESKTLCNNKTGLVNLTIYLLSIYSDRLNITKRYTHKNK